MFTCLYLFYVIFSELPKSMVLCLSLILEVSLPYIYTYIFLLCPLFFSNSYYFHFLYCFTVLRCSVLLCLFVVFIIFFSLHFSLGSFYWPIFNITDYFPKYIIYQRAHHCSFLLHYFWLQEFLLGYFLDFSFSLFILPDSSCMLCTFSFRNLRIQIITYVIIPTSVS